MDDSWKFGEWRGKQLKGPITSAYFIHKNGSGFVNCLVIVVVL